MMHNDNLQLLIFLYTILPSHLRDMFNYDVLTKTYYSRVFRYKYKLTMLRSFCFIIEAYFLNACLSLENMDSLWVPLSSALAPVPVVEPWLKLFVVVESCARL